MKYYIKSSIDFSGITGQSNVKETYMRLYPDDDLGEDINPNITFYQVVELMINCEDIYDILGVWDSVIRERVFEIISRIANKPYRIIYNYMLRFSSDGTDWLDVLINQFKEGIYSFAEYQREAKEYTSDEEIQQLLNALK